MVRTYVIFASFILFSFTAESSSIIASLIKSKFELLNEDGDTKISGEKLHSIEYIANLYSKNNFEPFWVKEDAIEEALACLARSEEDGLLAQDYHTDAIYKLRNELQQNRPDKENTMADLDILLTDGIIFYADHLLYGKINPVTLEPTWNFVFAPIPDLEPASFNEYIANNSIASRLEELRPQVPMYDTLVALLAKYRKIEANGGWHPVPSGGKIEPGAYDDRIPAIRDRLLLTGKLSHPDSIKSKHYDTQLERDIRAFQSAHGLEPDGIIGVGTFRELNVPVSKRIDAIRVNLERARWVSGNLPDSYIIVNIAAFWLVMVKEGQRVLTEKVVVGRPLNKTPVFRDKIRYIEFNPSWTQPTSIVKNETIPKLKKDSSYLEKNHMVLLDSKGNEVDISGIDLQKLSPSRFPYLVRQKPGPWNALGEMKFMFPNKYDIYLHDTPSKSYFNKSSRAYSHGCIRVKNPKELAVKLLEGTVYDSRKIKEILDTHETTRVNLPQPIDVLLIYWTCGLDPDGKPFFFPDIYDRDQAVVRELDKVVN